jgi:predicted PurR-regulated permease PerM
MSRTTKVEISHKTIIFTFSFLVLAWFLYSIRDLILGIFVALLIMVILNPLANRLSKYKIPRAVSVLIVYLLGLSVLGVVIWALVPPLVEQTGNFVNGLPAYLENVGFISRFGNQGLEQITSQLGSIPAQVAKLTLSLLSNFMGVLTVLIFAFYFLVARDKLDDQLIFLFGKEKRKEISETIDRLEVKLGGWARGQIILMLLVGVSTYVGLVLLGIPHALPLGILAGLFEIIPYFGPVLAAVPATVIGFGTSPVMGFAVLLLSFLIQQLENYIFVPKVMEKSAGVSPIITLIALAIGFRVAGITGVVISVPVVITIQVLFRGNILPK